MTTPAHPDRQGTREELAAALDAFLGYLDRDRVLDALLPVVERLCDQRAAEAARLADDRVISALVQHQQTGPYSCLCGHKLRTGEGFGAHLLRALAADLRVQP